VLKVVTVLYDRSPKLRIRGSGFTASSDNTFIDIGTKDGPSLLINEDFTILKDDNSTDGIILKLMSNKRWVDIGTRAPPIALFLNGIYFSPRDSKNLLFEPVLVAQVLFTPTVQANSVVIYSTATNVLRINGTGFDGAKEIDLYFQPPLLKEIAYEDVSSYPLDGDMITLRLRDGYSWRDDVPGSLVVKGIDTGGGAVKINGDAGVVVAEVQADLDQHRVSVETTLDDQLVYDDELSLVVYGSGFNPTGTALRWVNGLKGGGVNYTTSSTSDSKITLSLVPGSHWRLNFDNLPGALTLLAVDAGEGFVAAGPINSQKGRDIAMVFERPALNSSISNRIYQSHSHELHIFGTGFPTVTSGFKPQLTFEPALSDDDYSVRVVSRKEIVLTLGDKKQWRSSPGALSVKSINTRGDKKGWVDLNGGVKVADVVTDVDAAETGGVELYPQGKSIYQSALQKDLSILGSGLDYSVSLVFDPPITLNVDYSQTVSSPHQIDLRLLPGKRWSASAGSLWVKSVVVDGTAYPLAGGNGIRVAEVYADPSIEKSVVNIHKSQSKLLVISGSGFTDIESTTLELHPTDLDAYEIKGVLDDMIRIQLKSGKKWLPDYASLKDEDDKIELKVVSIDTGAGEIKLSTTIGSIINDREGVTCDDSCPYAFDGVCDDGSEPLDAYYYQNYGYQDDSLFDDYGGNFGYDGRRRLSTDDNIADDGEDDYYMESDDSRVSACLKGTDCTDCGGVDALRDYSEPADDEDAETCVNTCQYARDGVCDDPRGNMKCALGTDCEDCGPVGYSNFTVVNDDKFWDDDDNYFDFNDAEFLEQVDGLEANKGKVKTLGDDEEEEVGSIFLLILEGMIYTVGSIFFAIAAYFLYRCYKGESMSLSADSELSAKEFELRPTQKMAITPDEFRT